MLTYSFRGFVHCNWGRENGGAQADTLLADTLVPKLQQERATGPDLGSWNPKTTSCDTLPLTRPYLLIPFKFHSLMTSHSIAYGGHFYSNPHKAKPRVIKEWHWVSWVAWTKYLKPVSTVWKCDEKGGRSERCTEKREEGRISCDQAIDYDKTYRQVREGTRQGAQQGLARTWRS